MINTDSKPFGTVLTAMVTPFDSDLKIDYAACERLIEHLIATGTTGIVVAGTTGESPTLEDTEKKELLKFVLSKVNKRVSVIMGTGYNDTNKTIKATKEATEMGANGLLVVAPYYNKPNQDGIRAHFGAVAAATNLPIIVYNIPGRTGVNITPETILAMTDDSSNIAALKDSTGSVEQAQEVGRLGPSWFKVYSGDDYLTLPFLSIGACGVVSVASHLIGSDIAKMIAAFGKGNIEEARALHYQWLPLFKGLFLSPNPTCVKYALSKLGIISPYVRLPLVQPSEAHRKAVDELIATEQIQKSTRSLAKS